MKIFALISLLIIAFNATNAKIFSKCDFAKAMKNSGIPKSDIADWVCLVTSESGLNTAAKNTKNSNGSYDWGIFQINDKYWCMRDRAGNDCNIKCSGKLEALNLI